MFYKWRDLNPERLNDLLGLSQQNALIWNFSVKTFQQYFYDT